jgi:electron transfer flavoprotein alpha subunit
MVNSGVMICGEITEGTLDLKTLELLGIGKKLADDLGTELLAVVLGNNLAQIAEEISFFGATKVYKIEDPLLGNFKADLWVEALDKLCKQINPKILLMLHSAIGIDVAPRLAFRLNTLLTTDCIGLEIDPSDGLLLRTKPVYGGNAIAVFKAEGKPQFATVRKKAMKPAEQIFAKSEIIDIAPDIDESMVKIEFIKRVKEEAVELEKADVIISGGRGIGGIEGFKELEQLADLFKESFDKVEIGASRAAVDLGWVSSNRQVGLTGEKVSPTLYIAVGISGATQHLIGMVQSKKIVAINIDPKSNIFKVAEYGVVGDYKEVLPAFRKKWKELS